MWHVIKNSLTISQIPWLFQVYIIPWQFQVFQVFQFCGNPVKCCISALPEFNQLFDFFSLFDSRLILTMLYDSVNHIINAFSPQGCWGMVQEKGSRQRCRSWTVLHTQCNSALSSGFPISQGNAEALERWGGKTKHHLISYLLSNTSAKKYCNRIVYVKTIHRVTVT